MTEIKPGTPLPWTAGFNDVPYEELGFEGWTVDAEVGSVCTIDGPLHERERDARYIVTACNAYPSLLNGLREAREALQAMMDAWFDYHDAHSLTQSVTGRADNAFDKALAARDHLDTLLAQEGEG